jgi:hypothetical protein
MNKSYKYLIEGGGIDFNGNQIENMGVLKKYFNFDVTTDTYKNKNFNLNISDNFLVNDKLKEGIKQTKCMLMLNDENTKKLLYTINYLLYMCKLNFLEHLIYKQISYYEDIDTLLFNLRNEIYFIVNSKYFDKFLLYQEQIFNEDILKDEKIKTFHDKIKELIDKYKIELIKLKDEKFIEINEIIKKYKDMKLKDLYFEDLINFLNRDKYTQNQIKNIIQTYENQVVISEEELKFENEYIEIKKRTQSKITEILKSSSEEKDKQITKLRDDDANNTKKYLMIMNKFRISRILNAFKNEILKLIKIYKQFKKNIYYKYIDIKGIYITYGLFNLNVKNIIECLIIGFNIKNYTLIIDNNNIVNIKNLCINMKGDLDYYKSLL